MHAQLDEESSVKTKLSLWVLGKRFNECLCVAIKLLVFVFHLNRESFFGFGPYIGYKFFFCLILK